MAGLYDLLYVGNSGLQAYQRQINVRSQNIANVDTIGYSRRYLEQESVSLSNGYGTGVRTGDVIRSFNSLGTSTLLREESSAEYHAELSLVLSQLEQLVGSGSSGLSAQLQDFELAWQDLAAAPADMSVRNELLQKASSLAASLNISAVRIDDYVTGIASDTLPITGSSADVVTSINSITERLQEINDSIRLAENAGHTTPDLYDERDLLIRDLSTMVNITVTADYRVSLGSQELVSADGLSRQELTQTSVNTFEVGGTDVTADISGGSLAALMTARNIGVTMRSQLDDLAASLATQINSVFDSSYNLNGETPTSLGYTFFTGTTADTIAVDTMLYDPTNPMASRPDLIAAASTRASAGPPPIPNAGDNSAAQAIVTSLQSVDATLNNQSVSDFMISFESDLASIIRDEAVLASDGEKVVEMLSQQMESVSGVNLDEEMMYLMSSQRAYEASARVISTANGMMDTLFNMVR